MRALFACCCRTLREEELDSSGGLRGVINMVGRGPFNFYCSPKTQRPTAAVRAGKPANYAALARLRSYAAPSSRSSRRPRRRSLVSGIAGVRRPSQEWSSGWRARRTETSASAPLLLLALQGRPRPRPQPSIGSRRPSSSDSGGGAGRSRRGRGRIQD
ncbi:hypothetical protein BS78_06G015500 [Paspalum vaginatum]|nr:hypothetical protein BS78_06G015500 [Paspalum vaginatum]